MIHKKLVEFNIEQMLFFVRDLIEKDPEGRINKSTGKKKENGAQHTIERNIVFAPLIYEIECIASQSFTNFFIGDIWTNINYPNGTSKKHLHIDSDISGCFYLYVPENSGEIEFESGEQILPKAGEIYWWNLNKIHWVNENKSNETRMSIAFNIKNLGN